MNRELVVKANFFRSQQSIVIRQSVLDHLKRYKQDRFWKKESGGQLFGSLKSNFLEVTLATGPYRGDLRSRFGYRSKAESAQREILKQRERGLYYCGDWHTHPESNPTASEEDITTICKMIKRSDFRLNNIVMIIQGTDVGAQGIAVYTSTGEPPKRWIAEDAWIEISELIR